MKVIVGIGNPGIDYAKTRHNVGRMVADRLSSDLNSKSKVLVFESQNFMNQSGEFVSEMLKKHKSSTSDLYIIHDDLDIRLGEYKIQFGRGPKDHNGLKSIDDVLGTDEYWHVRVGIDNRPLDGRPMGDEYVLQNFSEEEAKVIEKVISMVSRELIRLINK